MNKGGKNMQPWKIQPDGVDAAGGVWGRQHSGGKELARLMEDV